MTTTTRKRILIVEDESSIALSLEFLMHREGHQTRIADDGDLALEAAREFKPHLVLLDIMLPRRNGFDVCKELRLPPLQQGMRIVMLTARGRDTEIAKGYGSGADSYITKPFSTHELLDTVRQLLRTA